MNRLLQKRLVDRLIEAYVSWREACLRVSEAYGSWARETGPGARFAFGSYIAALDQEERAAEVYAGLVRRARHCRGAEPSGVGGRLAMTRAGRVAPTTAQR